MFVFNDIIKPNYVPAHYIDNHVTEKSITQLDSKLDNHLNSLDGLRLLPVQVIGYADKSSRNFLLKSNYVIVPSEFGLT